MTRELDHRGSERSLHTFDRWGAGLVNRAQDGHFTVALGQVDNATVLLDGWIENSSDVFRRYGKHLPATHRIARAVIQAGPRILTELKGAYLVLVVDGKAGDLYALRDARGLRPAYFWSDDRRLAMASEVRAVLAHPTVPRELDTRVLGHLLVTGLEPDRRSLARNVRKLPAGHLLHWRAGETPRIRQLKSLIVQPKNYRLEEAANRLQQKLHEGLRRRLADKAAIGVLLSGGVDSYLLAKTTKQLLGERVRTATVGVRSYELDETQDAAELAQHLNVPHLAVRWSSDPGPPMLELLRRTVATTEQPGRFANAPLVVHLLDRWSDRGSVILTGDSADGLFGNYGYREFEHVERLRRLPFRRALGRLLTTQFQDAQSRFRRIGELLTMRRHDFRLFGAETFKHDQAQPLLGFDPEKAIQEDYRSLVHQAGDCTPSQLFCYVERRTAGQGVIDKLERLVSGAGSDLIHPFLMPDVARLGFELPAHLKARRGKSKLVPRHLASRTLPENKVSQKKIGFAAPRIRWLKRDPSLREGIYQLTAPDARIASWVDRSVLKDAVRSYRESAEDAPLDSLWILLSTELWCQELEV